MTTEIYVTSTDIGTHISAMEWTEYASLFQMHQAQAHLQIQRI
jgi:hypothetical protein